MKTILLFTVLLAGCAMTTSDTAPPFKDAGKIIRYEDGKPCFWIYSESQVRCFET